MRNVGINVNVHYRPVYQHSFYQTTLGYKNGLCPNAERAYSQILTLPIYPSMSNSDIERVILELEKATQIAYSRSKDRNAA